MARVEGTEDMVSVNHKFIFIILHLKIARGPVDTQINRSFRFFRLRLYDNENLSCEPKGQGNFLFSLLHVK